MAPVRSYSGTSTATMTRPTIEASTRVMAGKIENYQLDTGRLPGRLEDLVSAPSGASGWLGPYAKVAELNDPWGNALLYRAPGQGQPFDLISLGKDGREGGSSYDADIHFE